ncbi:MAG: hypothetical protein J5822_02745 [Eubacteriaceae bacterium]|nr:hypothetical protein [Eubacteriaceae bacterium]
MARRNHLGKTLISLILISVLLIGGCGEKTEGISPTLEEINSLSTAAGFLAAKVIESGGFIASEAQREKASDYAYIYDNAMAAVVLSRSGAQPYAEIIADAIVFAQTHDRTFQDGRLRNTYNSGDPEADAGRTFASNKVTVRIPGFWYNGRWQEDLYTVSTSTGNMAWTIMALCETAKNASEEKASEYLEAAVRAADFVLTLKSKTGGFTAGYEGWDDAQTKVTYQSTEHNIDLYCAFRALAKAIESSDPAKAAVYSDAAEYAKDFVMSMYDEDLHCFYTGTEDDGVTVSEGVIPLDTNSLSILAFWGELEDTEDILSFVDERMAVDYGYDFSAGDLDGIWNEGTAQMAVCYFLMGDTEKYDLIMDYLNTQVAGDGSITAADKDDLSTGFIISGTDDLWVYNNEQSIGATCWLAFAQLGINPFDLNVSDPQ